MRLNALQKSQISKILWITVAWTAISLFQFLIGYGTMIDRGFEINFDVSIPLKANTFTGIFAGLLGGTILVLVWEKWLRTKPYGWTLRNIFLTYVIVFYLVSVTTGLYYHASWQNESIFSSSVWEAIWSQITHPVSFIPFFFWLFVVIGTLITLLVNDKYGPGVFVKFLMGKFFNPTREERIFMFLDLKSSTHIAEEMGEEKYFNFLKEIIQEVTPAILKSGGEIYQYVGDEIVISWKAKEGFKDGNCLQCFLEIKQTLEENKEKYLNRFEHFPEFKAGIHHGHVMAGEIGVIKREIAYSGDVLNTTSRIQGLCNKLNVDLLLSKTTAEALQIANISFKKMGNLELRGKRERMDLFSLREG